MYCTWFKFPSEDSGMVSFCTFNCIQLKVLQIWFGRYCKFKMYSKLQYLERKPHYQECWSVVEGGKVENLGINLQNQQQTFLTYFYGTRLESKLGHIGGRWIYHCTWFTIVPSLLPGWCNFSTGTFAKINWMTNFLCCFQVMSRLKCALPQVKPVTTTSLNW